MLARRGSGRRRGRLRIRGERRKLEIEEHAGRRQACNDCAGEQESFHSPTSFMSNNCKLLLNAVTPSAAEAIREARTTGPEPAVRTMRAAQTGNSRKCRQRQKPLRSHRQGRNFFTAPSPSYRMIASLTKVLTRRQGVEVFSPVDNGKSEASSLVHRF